MASEKTDKAKSRGGKNAEQRFRDGGVNANRISPSQSVMAAVRNLHQAPPGHALFDPRSKYAVDMEMALDMVDRFVRGVPILDHAILAREEKRKDDRIDFHVCNGSQRTNALRCAEEILRERGFLKPGDDLMVKVDLFVGDDRAFLEARLTANADKWRKPDKPSVLAVRTRQLLVLGSTYSEIAKRCTDDVTPAVVEALERWPNLTPEAQARFEDGAPIGLLPAVLDAPRDGQVEKLDELIANGLKTTTGATRHENKKRAERAATRGEAPAKKRSPKTLDAVVRSIAYPATEVEEATAKLETFGAEAVALHSVLYGDAFAAGIRFARGERVARMPKPIAASVNRVLAGKKEKKS